MIYYYDFIYRRFKSSWVLYSDDFIEAFLVKVQKTAPHLKYKASDMKNIIVIPSEDIPV